ncbi:MAG: hypothetical protein JSS82_18675 [Bacteroidetes bacterium]|nr:hypothetical protein [Bacteroidota bacterium]
MAFKLFRRTSGMIKPTTRVYKEQIIEGFSIPAIIRNGNYFFVDIDVYENGRVECWHFEDFEHFKKDVQRGWVSVNIPDNNDISIHGLGTWTIEKGKWDFSKDTFVEYVQDLIKELNPSLDNIFKYRERKINGITVSENGNGTIYKQDSDDYFAKKIEGQSVNLFYKMNSDFYLTKVNVFADGSLELARLEKTVGLTVEELEKQVRDGNLLADIPLGSTIHIYGLGKFSIQKKSFASSIQDKLLEIKDIQRKLKGDPTTIELCRSAYKDYLANPTKSNQENLRVAYENVPNHQRAYVGDMDTKDVEVRMIIYGDHEIENWSHYMLAKKRGEPLPNIVVPKPKDG